MILETRKSGNLARSGMCHCSIVSWPALQMTTGYASFSIIGGLTPTFRGTVVVHNQGFDQSVTLEFQDSSAWWKLSSKKTVKDGVSPAPANDLERRIAKQGLVCTACTVMLRQWLARHV